MQPSSVVSLAASLSSIIVLLLCPFVGAYCDLTPTRLKVYGFLKATSILMAILHVPLYFYGKPSIWFSIIILEIIGGTSLSIEWPLLNAWLTEISADHGRVKRVKRGVQYNDALNKRAGELMGRYIASNYTLTAFLLIVNAQLGEFPCL